MTPVLPTDLWCPSQSPFALGSRSQQTRTCITKSWPNRGQHGTSVTCRDTVRNDRSAAPVLAQYAAFDYGTVRAPAAWTALGGLEVNGTSAVVSGHDACSASPTIGGVAVPSAGYDGSTSVPTGAPDIVYLGTTPQSAAAVEVDWNAIVNGTAMPADITLSGSTGWPTSSDWSNPDYWPVIRVNGDIDLPSDGRGTLIVTGNLTLSGSVGWRGLILVGNALGSNGNNTVHGSVITGLNLKLGMSVSTSDLGNGNKSYRYNSCDLASAMSRFKKLVPYRNAGADNLPVY
jgi:hypothetical protein